MKKLVSVLLALIICIGQLSVVSVASFDDTDYLSVNKFSENLVDLINKTDESVELYDSADLYYSSHDGVGTEADEPDCTTLRLIVKSEKKLPELDSVGYIYGYNDLHILQFDDTESFENAKEYYASLSCVEYVEEDKILTSAEVDNGIVVESVADYPTSVHSNLFGYTTAKANSGNNRVDIAVVDSGVQHDHEFLSGRVVDTGFNSITDNGTAYDDRGHGTHVAGIIVANTNSNVTVYAYKVLNARGEGTAAQIALGIDAAIDDGMNIINLSVQMEGISQTIYDAVLRAYNAGITIVAAAGNASKNLTETPYSPGSFEEVISVMSCSNSRRISSFSNYGTPCDFAAPGENVLSSHLDNKYKISSGTSMAAPFICVAISYLLSENSSLSPDKIVEGLSTQTEWCYGSPSGKCVYPGTKVSLSGTAATPAFEVVSCGFIGSMRVDISCKTAGADIFYSLNGENTYYEFSEPFYIDDTATITAFSVASGYNTSSSASVTYTRLNGNASDFTVDETDTLVAYNGSSVSVDVPSFVNGNRIKNVDETAFSGNTTISSVKFEESLITIGSNAFVGCDNLVSVRAPAVTEIGNSAFKECKRLTSVTSYELKIIGDGAFYGCSLLTNVLHDKVEVIGTSAFENTEKLKSFSSSYVAEIGRQTFKNSGITSLGIGSAKEIGDSAFSGCVSLTEAVLTSAVSVGKSAFENCTALTTVSAPALEVVSEYCFSDCEKLATVSMAAAKLVECYAFADCSALKSYSGFSNVEEIRAYAFKGTNISSVSSANLTKVEPFSFSKALTNVSMPIKSVDLSMFEGSENISYFSFGYATELIFPEDGLGSLYPSLKTFYASNITELPDNAFNGCSYLDTHSLSNLVSVGANAFKGTAIKEISFSSLTSAGYGAFSNTNKVTTVNLPVLKSITEDMFKGNTSVTTAYFDSVEEFPDGISVKTMFPNVKTFAANKVEEIPAEMFKGCINLNSANFGNLYVIGERAFQNCALTTINFYADTIGEDAFDGNLAKTVRLDYIEKVDCDIFGSSAETIQHIYMNQLKDLGNNTLQRFTNLIDAEFNSLENVPDNCFNGLKNLAEVALPEAQSIGKNAFYNCNYLGVINIGSAETIGENAFYNCAGLNEVYADSIEEIDLDVFDGCSNIYVLSLNSLQALPSSESGSLGDMESLEMLYLNAIHQVPAYAFENLKNLHTVSVRSATKIGDYAFSGTALKTIYANPTTIGTCAFLNTQLTSFSSSARYIGDGAFMGCDKLKKVTFTDVLTIGDRAFKNCSALQEFNTNRLNSVDIGAEAFYGCSNLNVFYFLVAKSIGSKALYGTAGNLSGTFEFSELLRVDENAFDGFKCDVLILENVEEIYDVPEGTIVLIGTDVKAGAISADTTATIYSPAGSVVSKYCIKNGVNYREFNETNAIISNIAETVSRYRESLGFMALGFNIRYDWYACNNEDMSDAVLVKSNLDEYIPFTTSTIGTEGDYKYYYCVVTSTENGNVVKITSDLVRNTYTYVAAKNNKTEIDYYNGYIFTGEKDIDAVRQNVHFEEECCVFVPSVSSNGTSLYGTGSSVNVYVNGDIKHSYILILDGDVNGDGYVDVLDCSIIANISNGLDEFDDENYEMAGDYFDGMPGVSAQDYQAVVNKAVS